MKVTVDDRKRVVLPGAKPGDCYDVEASSEQFRLTLLKPAAKNSPQARLVRRGGRTYLESSKQFTNADTEAVMAQFP